MELLLGEASRNGHGQKQTSVLDRRLDFKRLEDAQGAGGEVIPGSGVDCAFVKGPATPSHLPRLPLLPFLSFPAFPLPLPQLPA